MGSKVISSFRWVMVFPGSIGLSLIYILYVHPVFMEGFGGHIEHASNPLIASALAIVLAYAIAPKYKFKLALVMVGIWVLILLVCLFIVMFGIKVNGEEQFVNDGGVGIATTVVGMMVGVFITWQLDVWRGRVKGE